MSRRFGFNYAFFYLLAISPEKGLNGGDVPILTPLWVGMQIVLQVSRPRRMHMHACACVSSWCVYI